MDTNVRDRTSAYILARSQHPAWVILAARRGPLVLSCLQTLFEYSQNGIAFEDTLQSLADLLTQQANHPDFDVGTEDPTVLARRELRDWIRRGLIIERDGRLYGTDALEAALHLRHAEKGRLEQEFLPRETVTARLSAWQFKATV